VQRRSFLVSGAAASAPAIAEAGSSGYFRTGRRRDGHWCFLTPAGEPFFSIAMNHIDSATLRYPENIGLWRSRYGNSERRWIEESVAANLRQWGFNSVGWVQEVVIRVPSIHRHSRNWGYEQYQWLAMPYCHLLPFAETHQWEVETRFPDFFSKDWEEWCDYVARDSCQRMADDPKLIGYFYVDCPVWVHTGLAKWRGPLYDPAKLATEAGRRELRALAARYYQVTHDAVRRYDRNHLILGDRYEARQPVPVEVLEAAKPYVDVMSFQDFSSPAQVAADLTRFHELTGKPVLLADAAIPDRRTAPPREWGKSYAEMIRTLRELPGCVGWHVCGAYLKNRSRNWGFLDEMEQGDPVFLRDVAQANAETREFMRA
jgi:hypothetical protein